MIAATSKKGDTIKIFDIRNNEVLMTLTNPEYYNSHDYNTCTFGPCDDYLFAGGEQGYLSYWNISNS